MKKASSVILFSIILVLNIRVFAFDFVEPSKKDIQIMSRTVIFHDGSGEIRLGTGACRTGFFQLQSKNKETIIDFIQPCLFGAVTLKGTPKYTAQIGLGLLEMYERVSFNVAIDSSSGAIYWGSGLSLHFDDSFGTFETKVGLE